MNLRFLSKQTEVILHFIFVQDLPDEVTIGEDLGQVVWLCEIESAFNERVIKRIQFLPLIG